MASRPKPGPDGLHPYAIAIMRETGAADPVAAVRVKARALVRLYQDHCGPSPPPLDLEVLASLLGIAMVGEPPRLSPDAELVPVEGGGVELRVNLGRPATRRRFSIGHEIVHTVFPDFDRKVQCRKPRGRDLADPDDLIEALCDVGASELLFPLPWFAADAARLAGTAEGVLSLARRYEASPEATIRRLVEVSSSICAAIFLGWKLKPVQARRFAGTRGQTCMFGIDPAYDARALRVLRVDYCVASEAFRAGGLFVPEDKSVPNSGVIYEAAARNRCLDGEQDLDFGGARGRFSVRAIPLFTETEELGPGGERAVAVILGVVEPSRRMLGTGMQAGGAGSSIVEA